MARREDRLLGDELVGGGEGGRVVRQQVHQVHRVEPHARALELRLDVAPRQLRLVFLARQHRADRDAAPPAIALGTVLAAFQRFHG